jgi:hypothetical protein
VVAVVEHAKLHAVVLLAVDRVGLAAHVVIDAGGRHEVALVGGVDEHPPGIRAARERRDRLNSWASLADARLTIEPLVADDLDAVLGDELLEDPFGDVRLEDPHRAGRAVDGGRALAAIAEGRPFLPSPGLGPLVVPPDTVVELAGQAADNVLVAGVSHAEAAARQPAQVPVGRDDDHRPPHPRGLHRRGDPAARSAIDHDVTVDDVTVDDVTPETIASRRGGPHQDTRRDQAGRQHEDPTPLPDPSSGKSGGKPGRLSLVTRARQEKGLGGPGDDARKIHAAVPSRVNYRAAVKNDTFSPREQDPGVASRWGVPPADQCRPP